jgi:hypothetical protein
MPCCQRCTGLYSGALLALALHWVWRPNLSGRFLAAHGFFLLIAAPFGLHWLPQGPILRTTTGVLCGFAVASFLWLVPATCWAKPPALQRVNALLAYGLGLVCTVLLLPVAASSSSLAAGVVITGIAAAGVISLSLLTVLNLALGVRRLVRGEPWPRVQT